MNPSYPPDQYTPIQKAIELSIEPIEVAPKSYENPADIAFIMRDYPYQYIGYNTLNRPSTISDYCYYPDNCPNTYYPTYKYNKLYTNYQKELAGLGTIRYLSGWQQERDNNLNGCPVFNSNMNMPRTTSYVS